MTTAGDRPAVYATDADSEGGAWWTYTSRRGPRWVPAGAGRARIGHIPWFDAADALPT